MIVLIFEQTWIWTVNFISIAVIDNLLILWRPFEKYPNRIIPSEALNIEIKMQNINTRYLNTFDRHSLNNTLHIVLCVCVCWRFTHLCEPFRNFYSTFRHEFIFITNFKAPVISSLKYNNTMLTFYSHWKYI